MDAETENAFREDLDNRPFLAEAEAAANLDSDFLLEFLFPDDPFELRQDLLGTGGVAAGGRADRNQMHALFPGLLLPFLQIEAVPAGTRVGQELFVLQVTMVLTVKMVQT